MEHFDKASCSLALKVLSTVSGGLFAGAALYVDCVEAPARRTHDAALAITIWKPSFIRAKNLQTKMCLISVASSFGVYFSMRGSGKCPMPWLVAGTTMFAIIPYTLIFIRPVYTELLETEKCISVKGDSWITENLNYWSKLHSVRTVVSLGAFTLMAYALSKS
ncbi:uncharacterized protein LOC100205151 isoform X1 [Hydra vulgaris]|uniref:uncharacterized protein LOC100205151 isoform X1 n=1 Tax=Hydra vulgaris TaxID=6087 RepID=UPI000192599F|nr:uncharacterized protein LOC100205151 [Hydra vulgaris]